MRAVAGDLPAEPPGKIAYHERCSTRALTFDFRGRHGDGVDEARDTVVVARGVLPSKPRPHHGQLEATRERPCPGAPTEPSRVGASGVGVCEHATTSPSAPAAIARVAEFKSLPPGRSSR